jgi:glycerol kinase
MNTGTQPIVSKNKLVTTVSWRINHKTEYALEGSVFSAGAVVQWLRDGHCIINSSDEVEHLASTVEDNGGVYFVPAFAGLGAPYWDPYAQGRIVGLTRATKAGHIARAALESIAYQVTDILTAMESDSGIRLCELRVDGGACRNNLLMQFQADILGVPVVSARNGETTAMGAAYLANLRCDEQGRIQTDRFTKGPNQRPSRKPNPNPSLCPSRPSVQNSLLFKDP